MICKACGRITRFNFHVPDEVWEAVIPPVLQNHVVCLNCFDRYAREVNFDYSNYITELYFAGDRANYIFRTISSSCVMSDRD